jgi:hypothetical protein
MSLALDNCALHEHAFLGLDRAQFFVFFWVEGGIARGTTERESLPSLPATHGRLHCCEWKGNPSVRVDHGYSLPLLSRQMLFPGLSGSALRQ